MPSIMLSLPIFVLRSGCRWLSEYCIMLYLNANRETVSFSCFRIGWCAIIYSSCKVLPLAGCSGIESTSYRSSKMEALPRCLEFKSLAICLALFKLCVPAENVLRLNAVDHCSLRESSFESSEICSAESWLSASEKIASTY